MILHESLLHQVLISNDKVICFLNRFIAVSIPLNYNRKHVDHRQILLLSATWLLALAVASPVIFGINNVPQRDPRECKLEDNNYVVYSSVCSFFIPCPIMLLLYFGMFHGLRKWEEARKAKLRNSIQACRRLQHAAVATALPPLGALPRVIERDLAQSSLEELDDFTQASCPFPPEYKNSVIQSVAYPEIRNGQPVQQRKRAKINGRERKAMRVLPVVVGKLKLLKLLTIKFICATSNSIIKDIQIQLIKYSRAFTDRSA